MPSARSIRWARPPRAWRPACPSTRPSPPPRNSAYRVPRPRAATSTWRRPPSTPPSAPTRSWRAATSRARPRNIATHEYALTAGYYTEYPEDIKLIGLSFNTQLQWGGIALQGEVAYRQDMPLQFDDVELLFARADALRAGPGSAARHTAADHLPGRRAGGVDAHALRPARRLRSRSEGAGLGRVRHLPGAVHRHQDVCEHAARPRRW